MKKLLFVLLLLWPSMALEAQQRPIAGTTLQSTDTGANSLLVGCAIGSTTCTGGIKAGPIVGSTGTFTGAVIANSTTTGNKTLTLGGSPADNSASFFKFLASNSAFNWQIGTNATVAGGLEFTPSTAGGGSTFTTPVLLLSAPGLLTVNGAGSHTFGAGGTAVSSAVVVNGGNATGAGGSVQIQKNGAATILIGHLSSILGSGTSSELAIYAPTSSGIGFYTNASTSQKWGINAAGDFTIGSGSSISDSVGTPAVSSCGASPSIAGKDYAFHVNTGSTATTSCTVTLGHSLTGQVCWGNFGDVAQGPLGVSISAGIVTFTYASATSVSIWAGCRGF